MLSCLRAMMMINSGWKVYQSLFWYIGKLEIADIVNMVQISQVERKAWLIL